MNTVRASTTIQPQYTPATRGRQALEANCSICWLPRGIFSHGPPWSHYTTPMMM